MNRTSRTSARFEALETRQMYSGGTVVSVWGDPQNGMQIRDTAALPTGQIIAAGEQNHSIALERFNKDGSQDLSFGHNGFANTVLSNDGWDSSATRVLVQSDNKILVASYKLGPNDEHDVIITRYNFNGTPDTTFGANGLIRYNDQTLFGQLQDIALQPDGKIVITGTKYSDDGDFITARILPNGSLDGSFGDANGMYRKGYVTTDVGGNNDQSNALTIESDGKIVVGGQEGDAGDASKFALVRYTSDGRLDTTFGNNGIAITDFIGSSTVRSLATDGSTIYAAGELQSAQSTGDRDMFVIAKYNSAGQFDVHFGNGGAFSKPSNHQRYVFASKLFIPQPGKILLNGYTSGSTGSDIVAEQFNANGSKDTTFGQGGVITKSVAFGGSFAAPASVTQDGNILTTSGNSIIQYVEATPTVSLSFGQDGYEGGQNGFTWFKRDAAYNFPTTVYFTVGGTASPGADFTGDLYIHSMNAMVHVAGGNAATGTTHATPTGRFVIPAGQSAAKAFAYIVDDKIAEPIELITTTVQPDSHYAIGNAVSNISIIDNDSVMSHTVKKQLHKMLVAADLLA